MFSEQEEQLEAAALQKELDQNEADLEAIHKILSSPFVQRDAMREIGERQLQVLQTSMCLSPFHAAAA